MTDHVPDEVSSITLARTAARAADDKKGNDIVVFAVGDVLAITEYFVITSASNRRLVRTLVDEIETAVKLAHGRSPLRIEGITEQQWVLIDFGDVVVHVFSDEIRAYYEIERLYRDVPRVDWHLDAGVSPEES
ncbi:MAG: ribosome silencing factor [Ilumatobacteraceae bacterium]